MVNNEFLPVGVGIRALKPHRDDRGVFTEIFREEWTVGCEAVQWNVASSAANVLRGVHVHLCHADYLVVLSGALVLGLHDIRPESGSAGLSCMITLDAAVPRAITIPPGVCHGFYFPIASTHIYAVSAYWDPDDELGCRFDAGELGLTWPSQTPHLSERDRCAVSYRQMCETFRDRRAAFVA